MSAGFLEDADGNKSSSRLLVVLVGMTIIGVWGFLSVKGNEPIDLPWSILTLLFICVLGKNATGYLVEIKNNMLTRVDK